MFEAEFFSLWGFQTVLVEAWQCRGCSTTCLYFLQWAARVCVLALTRQTEVQSARAASDSYWLPTALETSHPPQHQEQETWAGNLWQTCGEQTRAFRIQVKCTDFIHILYSTCGMSKIYITQHYSYCQVEVNNHSFLLWFWNSSVSGWLYNTPSWQLLVSSVCRLCTCSTCDVRYCLSEHVLSLLNSRHDMGRWVGEFRGEEKTEEEKEEERRLRWCLNSVVRK